MNNEDIDNIFDALTLEQKVIFNNLKDEIIYLKKLLKVGHQISTSDLKTCLKLILDSIIELTQAKRGYLILLDNRKKLDLSKIISFNDQSIENDTLSISESIASNVIKSGKGELIENIAEDPNYRKNESIVKLKLKAIMCVPLMIKDEIIGLIYVDSDSYVHHFSKQGLTLFEALASQAAIVIENARLFDNLIKENIFLKNEIQRSYQFEEIIYQSKAIEDILQNINHVLDNSITILIQGETGTGKELIARAIHYNSNRQENPFIAINCGAITDSLLESELFGHKKGAFTGAIENKIGLFESANKGTIFLDEIGETTQSLQVRLLRVLETNKIRRIGETIDRKINVRVIAATNQELKKNITKGEFREDLYYRLNAFPINIPPLRDRKEDIPLLINHFVNLYNKKLDKTVNYISNDFIEKMTERKWNGNIRELKNFIYKKMVLLTSDRLTDDDEIFLNSDCGDDKKSIEFTMNDILTLDNIEKNYIIKVLNLLDWNKSRTAKHLGLNRSTLLFRMKKLNVTK